MRFAALINQETSLRTFRSKPIGLCNVCRHLQLLREVRCLASLVAMQVFPSKLARQTKYLGNSQSTDFHSLQTICAKEDTRIGALIAFIFTILALLLLRSWEQQCLQFQTQSRSNFQWNCGNGSSFSTSSSYCVPLIELNLPLVPLVHFDFLEDESMQELEDYAVQKAEETTAATYKALNLAEEITSVMLHEQGYCCRH
ncbi:hypothetical protein SELMODRAFT_432238 [Selaginella moellendorffii]|uniref:Uncharacterized protein n=1 Tax=Selaginella moellendorffii TaxID=88036 RepID=D8TFE3_SELML|nr:hypothetical protein SELMODRAFT_432238 [Selaginella moellendorffii]